LVQEWHGWYGSGAHVQQVVLPMQGVYVVELLTPYGQKSLFVVAKFY
jgi:hypothetical protein